MVPFKVATQEIHQGVYVASHIVGHNALEFHQVNGVLPPLEDPFFYRKHLGEIGQGFWTFLIAYHTFWYCCIISHTGDHSLLLLH